MPTPEALLNAPLRPEAKMLFLTAWGPAADASIVAQAPRIRSWPLVIAIAEVERATRVLWERLNAVGVRPSSPESSQQLEHLATIAAFRAEHLRARLEETLAVFAREGIDVVLLKGAALANTIYPSFIERPMGDLDLLLAPKDADRAHKAACTAGWTWNSTAFPRERYADHHHLPPLDDEAGTGVRLELHKGIAIDGHPFAITIDDLRARAHRVQVGQATPLVPSVEHLLLHEAVHFAWSHVLSFGAWRTARDVQFLAQRGGIDWDLFAKESAAHRADTCAYWTFVLSRLLAGAEIPDNVLRRMRPSVGPMMHRIIERHLVYHLLPIEEEWPSQRLRRSLWERAIQPDRHGHGALRPWEFDEPGPDPSTVEEPAPARHRADPMTRLSVWARYVRALA